MFWGTGHQLRKLSSEQPERQISAAKALGKSRDPRALRPLFDLLTQFSATRPETVKDALFAALTAYRDMQSMEFLVSALGDPESLRRKAASKLLEAMNCAAAVPPLVNALGDADARKVEAAAILLRNMNCPLAVPLLVSALGDAGDDRKVGAAASILETMKCREAIPALLSAFRENRGTYDVACALVELEAFEPLAELVHSGSLSSDAESHLVDACEYSTDPRCIELLLPFVRSRLLRSHALQVILHVNKEAARQALKRILPELDLEGMILCVDSMGLTEEEWLNSELRHIYQISRARRIPSYPLDSGCTEKLLAIYQSENESVQARVFAAGRLGREPDPRSASVLREIRSRLRSGAPGVWREAARELQALPLGAEDALDRLLVALVWGIWSELDAEAKAAIPLMPASIVENLIKENPYLADRDLENLEQAGWKPRTPGEAAVHHILRKEWNQLAATGQACLEPLVELVYSNGFDDQTRQEAASALEEVVESLHEELPESTLRYLWGLGDVHRIEGDYGRWTGIVIHVYSWKAMGSCIWRELERRGLPFP